MITNNGLQLFSLMWWRYFYRISTTDGYVNAFVFKNCAGEEKAIENCLRLGFLGVNPSLTKITLPYSYKSVLPNNDQSTDIVSISFNYPILCVGSGTTAPAREDYKLESCLTDLTPGNYTFSILGLGRCNISCQFINSTEVDTTVNEVGLYVRGGNSSNGQAFSTCIMVARNVLDTPIVIGAGQTATVNYTIDFTEIDG